MQRAGLDTGRVVPQLPQATATYTTFAAQCGRVSFHAAAALLILSLVGCAQPLRTGVKLSVGCSIVAHGVDTATTMYGHGRGLVKELNTLYLPHLDNPVAFGVLKMGSAVAINYTLLELAERYPENKWVLVTGIGQCAAVSAVGARNAHEIRKVTQ